MLTQTQLKEIFARYDFKPLKRFGENYLIDGNIKDKIIYEVAPSAGDIILEIGPGFGALTGDLAGTGASVFAVEKDKKACAILKELLLERFPDVKLFCEDIIKFDIKKIPSGKKIKVVGNLPYCITTPIIEYLIERRAYFSDIVILVQKEVANRLLADAGSEDYSSISCFTGYYTKPAYIYTVKRGSFYPAPDVDSSLIRLDIRESAPVAVRDEELFFRIIRGSFNQRRKSIINSLSRKAVLGLSKDELSKKLRSAGIDPASRPESLRMADFARISDLFDKNK